MDRRGDCIVAPMLDDDERPAAQGGGGERAAGRRAGCDDDQRMVLMCKALERRLTARARHARHDITYTADRAASDATRGIIDEKTLRLRSDMRAGEVSR